jgi:predicted amidophosphoribosyltransferase
MCAAPIATACPACQQDCLAGERYCACCGTAVQVEAHPRPVGAGPARPVPGDRQELALLAADLKLRSESEQARTDFGNKRHLAQADLDEMFAS